MSIDQSEAKDEICYLSTSEAGVRSYTRFSRHSPAMSRQSERPGDSVPVCTRLSGSSNSLNTKLSVCTRSVNL